MIKNDITMPNTKCAWLATCRMHFCSKITLQNDASVITAVLHSVGMKHRSLA